MYSFSTELKLAYQDFDDAINVIKAAFVAEKMGIVSEVNVAGIFKKKMDVDYPNYRILGACVAPLAKRVLDANKDAGVLLPCNVVVYEQDDKIMVSFQNPDSISQLADDPAITQVMEDAIALLNKVKARLAAE